MTSRRTRLILMIAMTALAISGTTSAQNLIGRTGASWQTCNLNTDINDDLIDLNSNRAPHWDVLFLAFGNYNHSR